MGQFLSSEVIGAAARRLVDSRARDGLVHFLLLKRALVRANANDVAFSSNDENFTGAMRDLAATYPPQVGAAAPPGVLPFVKVFGTAGADKYVSGRWTTNGPADALSGPRWTSVVRISGNRPRRGSFRNGYQTHLQSLLLKAGSELPSLLDAAIWYHRADDLDQRFGPLTDTSHLARGLRDSFKRDLKLTPEEIAALFDPESVAIDGMPLADIVAEKVADPQQYLPDLGAGNRALNEMLPAFEALALSNAVGLRVGHELLLRFTAALGAKRFLILGGLAGSGKTKLAQAFARWLTPLVEEGEVPAHAIIPVGADWTGNDNILGYPDGLDPKRYVTRPALEIIQRASRPENRGVAHFLILDEMNLSHVERYFADLLSLIELPEETIELYRPGLDAAGEPEFRVGAEPTLSLPPNLFIIGTVNVDETTYMFSPKVLDRANVIEFRMSRNDLEAFLAAPSSPALGELSGRGVRFGASFVDETCKSLAPPVVVRERFEAESLLFFELLRDHSAEFGFRVANEIARFLHFYRLLGGYADDSVEWFDAAMDAAIVQKLLPKLHGSRPKLEGLLWALAWACGAQRKGGIDAFLAECREAGRAQEEAKFGPEAVVATLGETKARYPLSLEKVMRMWKKLVRDQFVTFFEA